MAVYDSKYNGAELDDALDDALSHIQNTSNPHNVTKTQLGLGNVGDFKAVSTAANQGLSETEKSNARTNLGLGSMATKNNLTESDIPSIPKSKISDFPTSLPANGGNSATVNNHTVLSDVPANAVFTDTNTWRPLGTGATDACAGNDSRLSDARMAKNLIVISERVSSDFSITTIPDSNAIQGYSYTIILYNDSNLDPTPTDYVISLATSVSIGSRSYPVVTPDGNPIELTCPAGGYCEINLLIENNQVYARGI